MTLIDFINYFVLPVLSISVILIFIRFIKGPKMVDRIIALDLVITTSIGFISAYSILYNKPALLDVAMILALIAFLSTVAFTYYIQKKINDGRSCSRNPGFFRNSLRFSGGGRFNQNARYIFAPCSNYQGCNPWNRFIIDCGCDSFL